MNSEYETFSIEIPVNEPEKMKAFQELMNNQACEMNQHIREVAEKLGVSEGVAQDIVYLRTRSRWSQEKENHLLALAKAGQPLPNIMDYGHET